MTTVAIQNEARDFRRSLLQTILVPVSAILMAATFLTLLLFNLFEVIGWADHSNRFIYRVRTCEKLVIDMETGLRGYLLTNQKEFLEPYFKSIQSQKTEFQELRTLVYENPDQIKLFEKLIRDKRTWQDSAEADIARRSQSRSNVQIDEALVIQMRARKILMDQMRGYFGTLIQEEDVLRAQRFQAINTLKQQLTWSGSFLALALAAAISFHVWRQMNRLALAHRQVLQETEIRSAELRDQKEWLQVTLASIGDGVLAIDREGRILFMNDEAERLTGWNLAQAQVEDLASVLRLRSESTEQPVEIPVAQVLQEKRMIHLLHSIVLVERNGPTRPVEINLAPIKNQAEDILGVILAFRDVTMNRQAQQALILYSERLEQEVAQRTDALRASVTELESFSYTVSHDLRSPLRAMQGYAEAMLEDYGDRLDEEGKNYLVRIQKAAERLDQLIQDLLAYTRAANDDTPLAWINLDHLIRELIEQYPNLQAPAADIAVEGTLSPVMGRESSLTQIFSNLMGNAVKFVAPGVKPRVRIRTEDLGERVRVWVEDNGIGLAPENQGRAFRIFEQINHPRLYSGTGVGLAIVKRAVDALNAQVGVESTLGTGSRFWVELNKGVVHE